MCRYTLLPPTRQNIKKCVKSVEKFYTIRCTIAYFFCDRLRDCLDTHTHTLMKSRGENKPLFIIFSHMRSAHDVFEKSKNKIFKNAFKYFFFKHARLMIDNNNNTFCDIGGGGCL